MLRACPEAVAQKERSHRSVRLRSNSCTPTTGFQKLRCVDVIEWIEFRRACRVDPLLLLRRLKSVRPRLESRRTLRRVRTIAARQSLRAASVITLTSSIFARRRARVCGVAPREIRMPFAPLEVNAFRNSDCIAAANASDRNCRTTRYKPTGDYGLFWIRVLEL